MSIRLTSALAVPILLAAFSRAEEPKLFDVVLTRISEAKIPAIKTVREMTALGLKDAKDLVESAPKTVREGVTQEEGELAVKTLSSVMCKAELQPSKVTKLERFEVFVKGTDPARNEQTLATLKNNTGVATEIATKLLTEPGRLKSGLTRAEAERLKTTLTGIGTVVEVKESTK